ncbi:MAG: heme ABC exporter ATP-binding protein CcmA [Candidatus Hydrothermarchaeota archaeon]|nr:heme ABC exporter ATP-binding protein CcmA [Candidatus Hydrothermarchaeota archaeon]
MISLPAIEIKNITKRFGPSIALQDINLTVDAGQFYVLLGPNGAGKTTLIKVLSTILKPTSGRVLVNGHDTVKEAADAKKSIGLVSHNPLLYEELTVLENLKFYAGLFDVDADLGGIMDELGLSHVKDRMVGKLSRGIKQRAAIARALLHKPRILLLDEPTTGLDLKSRTLFYTLLQELRAKGATIVMSTHLLEEAANLCSAGVVLNRGRIVGEVDLSKGVEEAARILGGLA